MKLCVDCKHYNETTCTRKAWLEVNPVSGRSYWQGKQLWCGTERAPNPVWSWIGGAFGSRCGPQAKFWESK